MNSEKISKDISLVVFWFILVTDDFFLIEEKKIFKPTIGF